MAAINKPSQPLIPPTDVEEVEEIATNVAEAAIAADDTHAPLVDDKVPAANLPSYVDDVLNFDSAEDFPDEGEEGKIYVANDTNLTYRWSGVAYIQVGGASLGAGNGIDIENDIVSVDMDYVGNNLDHVTEAELADGLAGKQPVGDYATSAELGVVDTKVEAKADKPLDILQDMWSAPLQEYDWDVEQWLSIPDCESMLRLASIVHTSGPIAFHEMGGAFIVIDEEPCDPYRSVLPDYHTWSDMGTLNFYIYTDKPIGGMLEDITPQPLVEVWSYTGHGMDPETGDYNYTIAHKYDSRYATKTEAIPLARTLTFNRSSVGDSVSDSLYGIDSEMFSRICDLAIDRPYYCEDNAGHKYTFKTYLNEENCGAFVFVEPNLPALEQYSDHEHTSYLGLHPLDRHPVECYKMYTETDAETGDLSIQVELLNSGSYNYVADLVGSIDAELGEYFFQYPSADGIYRLIDDNQNYPRVVGWLWCNREDGWVASCLSPNFDETDGPRLFSGRAVSAGEPFMPGRHTIYATRSEVNTKQDAISDLATIRSGAAAGATAVQPAALNAYYTSAEVDAAIAAAIGNVLNEEF